MKRVLLLLLLSGLSACTSQDASDQAALRRLFSLPNDVQIVHYEGFPSQVGFGQREGLYLVAHYQLTPEQVSVWANDAPAGWEPLPMPMEVQAQMDAFRFEALRDGQEGYYFCRTAGDNVLHAKETRPCTAVKDPLDLIAGVVDLATGEMVVQVQSFY